MHIGFITSDLSYLNGWATYSLNLLQALHAKDIQTTVITAKNSPTVDFDIHPLLPSVTPPERYLLPKMMGEALTIRQLLADCDIIHSTIEPYSILADTIAGQRPFFMTAHGSYINLPRIRKFPLNVLYKRAFSHAQIICVSHYTAQVAKEIIPTAQTHVVHNGVDVDRFHNPPLLASPKTVPTVVTVGGIKPRKGTLELVEAMAIVREQIPDAQCLIMGNPQTTTSYYQQVVSAIEHHQLGDAVKIMGFVDDDLMRAWMGAADVLALPSINDKYWFEGFGLVLMEASASGTAVIGTDGCGVADAIDPDVTGLVIPQDNIAEALPSALIELLSNPDKAQQMGEAGRIKAQGQSWNAVAQQMIDLYQSQL